MKITEVDIPKSYFSNALSDIKMSKLGEIVVLVGKNGSGKTRILNQIQRTISNKPTSSKIKQLQHEIAKIKSKLLIVKNNIKSAIPIISRNRPKELSKEEFLEECKNNSKSKYTKEAERLESVIANLNKQISWDLIKTDNIYNYYSIIPFVPRSTSVNDCAAQSISTILDNAAQAGEIGIEKMRSVAFSKIQAVQNAWFEMTHPSIKVEDATKKAAIDEYNRLNQIIKIFMNTELERNRNGLATIFGLPLGRSKLSAGQAILIQFCVALHSQGKSLNKSILFLDEPENHLHPSAIIGIVNRLIDNNKDGQVWIATHSISLISQFDPSYLWYVDNGKVQHAGKIPEKVLGDLLGDENNISKLNDFISLPGQYATNRHAYESLFQPISVNTGNDDPQTLQIREEILNQIGLKSSIKVLDYGAGKGRILSGIVESCLEHKINFKDQLDYVAYDSYSEDKDICVEIIKEGYVDYNKRYFNDMHDLQAHHDRGSFDVVIMCNVLHEIDPKDWFKIFKKDGDLDYLLHDDGMLLLVEDHQMPYGEKAYQKGFIVLDTPELKDLFLINENDMNFGFDDAKGDGRLKIHRIPKDCLLRITDDSRRKALRLLNNTAQQKVLDIRSKEISYKNGKIHGFWIQQLANTQLALQELGIE